jgi:hypothetical protein|tara:strand:- start:282 stop:440 length:159 start_codon:yes stop_codon:yes gene_type:complete
MQKLESRSFGLETRQLASDRVAAKIAALTPQSNIPARNTVFSINGDYCDFLP